MTIAAGFFCADGLVLAADTLYTGESKRNAAKLWLISRGEVSVALAGAGDAVLIKKVRDEISRWLKQSASEHEIAQHVEDILYALYVKHVRPDPSEMSLEVLVGIRTTDGCSLYENSKTALGKVDKCQCIGAGTSLGLYFADSLFQSGMTIKWAQIIAAHLLQQTKQYARDCGGDSYILTVPASGDALFVDISELDMLEKYLGGVDAAIREVLIVGFDQDIPNAELNRRIEVLNSALRGTRHIISVPPAYGWGSRHAAATSLGLSFSGSPNVLMNMLEQSAPVVKKPDEHE